MGRSKITMPLGTRYGKLVVVGPFGKRKHHSSVICLCDCGTKIEVICSNLRSDQTTSCGCNKIRAKYQNVAGKTFGRLLILDDRRYEGQNRMVDCRCDCGKETSQPLYAVVDGRVVSCGCHRNEASLLRSTTHGHAKRGRISPEYHCWSSMKDRCENPRNPGYADYGGRGIKVCERWRGSFESFLWDMGDRPKGMTLDRYPDVNGNYEPGNVRWATPLQQSNNKRVTPMIEYLGRTQSIADWARELRVQYWSLRRRLVVSGWPVDKAMTTPFIVGRNQYD